MAKNQHSFGDNLSGVLDLEAMTITYEDKKGIKVFHLNEILPKYDKLNISFAIATSQDIEGSAPEEE